MSLGVLFFVCVCFFLICKMRIMLMSYLLRVVIWVTQKESSMGTQKEYIICSIPFLQMRELGSKKGASYLPRITQRVSR